MATYNGANPYMADYDAYAAQAKSAYEKALGFSPPKTEVAHRGPLPQIFGDQFGWEELVADVARIEATRPQLLDRGLLTVERRTDHSAEPTRQAGLALDVARAEAGVDEHESVALGLDDEHVGDHVAAPGRAAEQEAGDRAHRRAVEVMDSHVCACAR